MGNHLVLGSDGSQGRTAFPYCVKTLFWTGMAIILGLWALVQLEGSITIVLPHRQENQRVPVVVPRKKGTIPHESWCPQAMKLCNNSLVPHHTTCNLCQQKFLFILALGRTASTTLTWTLNALPGLQMGGENNGALNQFKDMLDMTAFQPHFLLGENNTAHPWGHSQVDPTDLYCAAQAFIRGLYPSWSDTAIDVLGFKTVRFLVGHDAARDEEYLEFLTTAFPCARFVINYRSDIDALAHSQNVAFGQKTMGNSEKNRLASETERLRALATKLGPDRAFRLDSSEWTKNVTKINGLVRWLGYGKACDFDAVLELNTAGYGYGNGKDHLEHRNPKCRYVGH